MKDIWHKFIKFCLIEIVPNESRNNVRSSTTDSMVVHGARARVRPIDPIGGAEWALM